MLNITMTNVQLQTAIENSVLDTCNNLTVYIIILIAISKDKNELNKGIYKCMVVTVIQIYLIYITGLRRFSIIQCSLKYTHTKTKSTPTGKTAKLRAKAKRTLHDISNVTYIEYRIYTNE